MRSPHPYHGRRPSGLTSAPARSIALPRAHATSVGDAVEGRPGERRSSDRRRHSLWSFLYGGVRPRRRAGRRHGDEQRIFLDWHEPRVLYLALAIVLMSCVDALFTLNLLAVGGEELNVVMRLLLDQDVRWFLWTKIGLTGAGVVGLVLGSRRLLLGRLPVLWLMRVFCAAYVALIGWEVYLLGWHATTAGSDAVDLLARWVAG
jgi:hypothetical protein